MSSNWEKLQKTLLKSTKKGRVEKKKNKSKITNFVTKKASRTDTSKSSEHDIAAAVLADAEKKKDSNDLRSFVEDNDLSASQIIAAYGDDASGLVKTVNMDKLGKYIAMDCEMVGVANDVSVLARVSIVNYHGRVVYDTFVRPKERVLDWRTWVSGVKSHHLRDAPSFEEAQKTVADILDGRVLVGHAVHHDLKALLLSHPRRMIRDTSKFPGYRKLAKGRTPSLKKLTQQLLGKEIQTGQHSSVQDAQATMELYKRVKAEMDEHVLKKHALQARATKE
ncbi:exoribonuclease Rex4 [Schizosaccharomyces japonicus yFS275]|uniref:RNA exonuclease 4 n=1 Tax=Schizosaccharomyces japonicus (strain yFS275 / FY16936) TaxID=402676 RepID=B6JWR3_SCHJY|nr:exoribonuclease Rex4 [Schizosaccharomyces japonicus yFS275]EEB05814.1 exoribonuclease Rex4 [Schizosaccharomyces japonicus yFS275]